jgi:hypothetical protein
MAEMTKSLFTVVLEIAGGTYIGQVSASDPQEAFFLWAQRQTDSDLAPWQLDRDELTKVTLEMQPIPLNGLVNIWCISASVNAGLLLANIVQTAGQ